jgi:hypothetical protein
MNSRSNAGKECGSAGHLARCIRSDKTTGKLFALFELTALLVADVLAGVEPELSDGCREFGIKRILSFFLLVSHIL